VISKHFYVQVCIRVGLISLTALASGYVMFATYYLLGILCIIGLIFQTKLLIDYVNRTNKKLAFFFEAIKNEDFSLTLAEDVPISSFRELHQRVNRTNEMIRDIAIANRIQESYYKEILNHADIGVFTYNEKGHVLFANPAVKKLLNCNTLNHIRQLKTAHDQLFKHLVNQEEFERKLVRLTNEREVMEVAMKAHSFSNDGTVFRLITLQDIRQELDVKETDSWMKLIRVLTHEIMNTVAPITSISDSILKYYKKETVVVNPDSITSEQMESTVKGLEVIKNQGGNLLDFVQSYRTLMNLPTPDKEIIEVVPFLEKIKLLCLQESQDQNVIIDIDSKELGMNLFADNKLLTQVLLNLVRNAIQSFDKQETKRVLIITRIDDKGEKYIQVQDNGSGITEDQLSNIFVPFYTTKEKGTGIGLSFSKRVMQLHDGQIQVYSKPGEGTTFSLLF